MITIKSPRGGFLSIAPVARCGKNCPWYSEDEANLSYCSRAPRIIADVSEDFPDWCPAIAAAQDDLPGTADLEFLLNDAIASIKNAPS